MIDEEQEENPFLDFKEKRDSDKLQVDRDDKKNYATALSGFSNSAGGIVIWGVKAKKKNNDSPNVAVEEKPISHLKKFLTDLNSLTPSAITPPNSGIQNIHIPLPKARDKGFVITYAPESALLTHRALLGINQYFIRTTDNFVLMTHQMLSDSFGRKRKPNLSIYYNILTGGTKRGNTVDFSLVIGIENTGKYIATYPAIFIKMESELFLSDCGVDGNGRWALKPMGQTTSAISKKGHCFAGGINEAIHPGTVIEVAIFRPKEHYIDYKTLLASDFNPEYFTLSYEIYAEGCEAKQGRVSISSGEVVQALKQKCNWLSDTM